MPHRGARRVPSHATQAGSHGRIRCAQHGARRHASRPPCLWRAAASRRVAPPHTSPPFSRPPVCSLRQRRCGGGRDQLEGAPLPPPRGGAELEASEQHHPRHARTQGGESTRLHDLPATSFLAVSARSPLRNAPPPTPPPPPGSQAKSTEPSGPNRSVGGDWLHTHQVVRAAREAAYPPLLWRYDAGWSRDSDERPMLVQLNERVHEFYACACRREKWFFGEAYLNRAVQLAAAARGTGTSPHQRLVGKSLIKLVGGNPDAWMVYGCSPARFYPYPRWPPARRWQVPPDTEGDSRGYVSHTSTPSL